MIKIQEIIHQLTVNAQAIQVLLQDISDEQAQWKPDPETWSMQQVMEHFFKEERFDFRMHLKEMLSDPPLAWGALRQQEADISVTDLRQALKDFLSEREASITWLKALESPNWDTASSTPFGDSGQVLTLRAGDVLVSWVAHDFLHIRQMNELLYAWNEKQSAPYSVEYAGGW